MQIIYRFNTTFTFFRSFGIPINQLDTNEYGEEVIEIGTGEDYDVFTKFELDGDPNWELANFFYNYMGFVKFPLSIKQYLFDTYKNLKACPPEMIRMDVGRDITQLAFIMHAYGHGGFENDADFAEFLDYVVEMLHGDIINATQNVLSSKPFNIPIIECCGKCDNHNIDILDAELLKNKAIAPIKDLMLNINNEKIDLNKLKNNKINVDETTVDKQTKKKKKQPKSKYIMNESEANVLFAKHKYVNVPIQITYRLESDDDIVNRFDFGYITHNGTIKSLCTTTDDEKRFIISISILPISVDTLKNILKK